MQSIRLRRPVAFLRRRITFHLISISCMYLFVTAMGLTLATVVAPHSTTQGFGKFISRQHRHIF